MQAWGNFKAIRTNVLFRMPPYQRNKQPSQRPVGEVPYYPARGAKGVYHLQLIQKARQMSGFLLYSRSSNSRQE